MKKMLSHSFVLASFMLAVACGNSTSSDEITKDTMPSTTNADGVTDKDTAEMSAETGVMVGGASMVPSKNIVENAANSSDHTTLVAAVKAADLVETLSGAGPFTVFAPVNQAFENLPKGTVEGLLKPEKKKDLVAVLTYHVVSGALKAADLKDGQKLKTVQGEELTVSVKDGKVKINNANVTIADVVSSNGVTHVIDGVLLPK